MATLTHVVEEGLLRDVPPPERGAAAVARDEGCEVCGWGRAAPSRAAAARDCGVEGPVGEARRAGARLVDRLGIPKTHRHFSSYRAKSEDKESNRKMCMIQAYD